MQNNHPTLKNSKAVLKKLLPPIFIEGLKRVTGLHHTMFLGPYASWQEAMKNATGYSVDCIIQKEHDAMKQVLSGKAEWVRDSVLFDVVEYPYPVIAALLKIALKNKGKIRVLDFGGALGTVYLAFRKFCDELVDVDWHIVEQPKYVDCGKQYYETNKLKFYYNLDEALQHGPHDVILLSGVLQYIENPLDFIAKVIRESFPYILIDRTFMTESPKGALVVQNVASEIYDASYPVWIFSRDELFGKLRAGYKLNGSFSNCKDEYQVKGISFSHCGSFWELL